LSKYLIEENPGSLGELDWGVYNLRLPCTTTVRVTKPSKYRAKQLFEKVLIKGVWSQDVTIWHTMYAQWKFHVSERIIFEAEFPLYTGTPLVQNWGKAFQGLPTNFGPK